MRRELSAPHPALRRTGSAMPRLAAGSSSERRARSAAAPDWRRAVVLLAALLARRADRAPRRLAARPCGAEAAPCSRRLDTRSALPLLAAAAACDRRRQRRPRSIQRRDRAARALARRGDRLPGQPADERPAGILRADAAAAGADAGRLRWSGCSAAGSRATTTSAPGCRAGRRRRPDLVEVIGRVAPPPARLFEFAADGGGPIRQNLDLDCQRARTRAAGAAADGACRPNRSGRRPRRPVARLAGTGGRHPQAPRLCLPVVCAVGARSPA